MMFSHPGSIEVVSWKDNLPHYIEIQEHPIEGEMVVADIGDSVSDALDRYSKSKVFATVADAIFSENVDFSDCSDHKEAFEKIFSELTEKRHLACPESEVEARL